MLTAGDVHGGDAASTRIVAASVPVPQEFEASTHNAVSVRGVIVIDAPLPAGFERSGGAPRNHAIAIGTVPVTRAVNVTVSPAWMFFGTGSMSTLGTLHSGLAATVIATPSVSVPQEFEASTHNAVSVRGVI